MGIKKWKIKYFSQGAFQWVYKKNENKIFQPGCFAIGTKMKI